MNILQSPFQQLPTIVHLRIFHQSHMKCSALNCLTRDFVVGACVVRGGSRSTDLTGNTCTHSLVFKRTGCGSGNEVEVCEPAVHIKQQSDGLVNGSSKISRRIGICDQCDVCSVE